MNFYKSFIILVLTLPLTLSATPGDRYKKDKKINKTYTVDNDVMVVVNNSFGNVTVNLWNKNTVSIDVHVSVSGNDEENVNDRLQRIDVDFKASRKEIEVISNIPSESRGFLDLFKSSSGTNTQVNMTINIPVMATMDLTNDYGAVIIDRMNAPLKLNCDFGRLEIGQLLHTDNELSFDYTEQSHIDYFKGGTISADFSKFKVYGADFIDFSGDYTTMNLKKVNQLTYNSDFSTLKIEESVSIDGRGDYSTVEIESFEKRAVLKADFGSLRIRNIDAGFDVLKIKSDYTTISLNYRPDAAFVYDISTEYGNLKLDAGLTTVNSSSGINESQYIGYLNNKSAKSSVEIDSSFGTVTLKSNN